MSVALPRYLEAFMNPHGHGSGDTHADCRLLGSNGAVCPCLCDACKDVRRRSGFHRHSRVHGFERARELHTGCPALTECDCPCRTCLQLWIEAKRPEPDGIIGPASDAWPRVPIDPIHARALLEATQCGDKIAIDAAKIALADAVVRAGFVIR